MASALEILNRHSVLRTIYLLREDVSGPSHEPSEAQAGYFLLWAAVWGRKQYHGIVIDADYLTYLSSPTGPYLSRLEMFLALHAKRSDLATGDFGRVHAWYYSDGVRDFDVGMLVTAREIDALARFKVIEDQGEASISLRDWIIARNCPDGAPDFDLSDQRGRPTFRCGLPADGERSIPPWLSLPATVGHSTTGVNLIGFADGVLGLGEDVRALANVLRHAGVPHAIVNVTLSEQHATVDPGGLTPLFTDRPVFPINIFCIPAFETERIRVERGANLFADRYNIGYWPWELSDLPPCWHHAFDSVDEIWALSHFLVEVYARRTNKPVVHVPPYVNIDAIETFDRAELDLAADDFVFLVMFDFNSHVARKNPLGAIAAFKAAFAKTDGRERLLIKTINGHAHPEKLDELLALIDNDPRIVLMDGPLSRAGVCGLISAVDCFVSLHRAEGFGRIIAEAMFLGTPVIATDYSGSRTFLDRDTGFPVAYELRDVRPGEYVFEAGSQWAEPDIADAAESFRIVRSRKSMVGRKVANAGARIRQNYGIDAVARIVADRVASIGPSGFRSC